MLKNIFNKGFNNQVDALGLSVFRVLYAILLFCETSQLYTFRHIIYDKEPFAYVGEIDITFIFFFWFVVLGLLTLGLFTRLATILNYIFGVIIFSSAQYFEYHIFYTYVTINFLLLFIPISRVFSLDSMIKKVKYTTVNHNYQIDRKVLEINYLAIIFGGIALVYFDSVFMKLSSPMWLHGLGMWLPSSLPMVTWNDTSMLLNQEWLMKFLGYFVIVFEGVFIFLFWFKRLRVPLMLIGIFFHIGIIIIYPIPWFALTVIAIYLLMMPEGFWIKLSALIKSKSPSYRFYYDAECPLCAKVAVVIKHLDVFNRIDCLSVQQHAENDLALSNIDEEKLLVNIHGVMSNGSLYMGYDAYRKLFQQLIYTFPIAILMGLPGLSILGKKLYKYIAGDRLTQRCTSENCFLPVYTLPPSSTTDILVKGWNTINISKAFWKGLLLLMFFFQFLVIWTTPMIQSKISKNSSFNQLERLVYYKTKFWTKKFLGITRHTVFLNDHFYNYQFIYKISCINGTRETLVPLTNTNGMPDNYNYGALWCNYTFNVAFNLNKKLPDKNSLNKGIKLYCQQYLKDTKLKKDNLHFVVYVKQIDIPSKWESDFLKKQNSKRWLIASRGSYIKNDIQFVWSAKMDSIFNNIK